MGRKDEGKKRTSKKVIVETESEDEDVDDITHEQPTSTTSIASSVGSPIVIHDDQPFFSFSITGGFVISLLSNTGDTPICLELDKKNRTVRFMFHQKGDQPGKRKRGSKANGDKVAHISMTFNDFELMGVYYGFTEDTYRVIFSDMRKMPTITKSTLVTFFMRRDRPDVIQIQDDRSSSTVAHISTDQNFDTKIFNYTPQPECEVVRIELRQFVEIIKQTTKRIKHDVSITSMVRDNLSDYMMPDLAVQYWNDAGMPDTTSEYVNGVFPEVVRQASDSNVHLVGFQSSTLHLISRLFLITMIGIVHIYNTNDGRAVIQTKIGSMSIQIITDTWFPEPSDD